MILLLVIFIRGILFSPQRYTKGAFSSCDDIYSGWPNVYTEAVQPARGTSPDALYFVYIRHTLRQTPVQTLNSIIVECMLTYLFVLVGKQGYGRSTRQNDLLAPT